MSASGRIVLVLEPIAGSWRNVPVNLRVRRAVKALGRSFGLRVVECRAEDGELSQERIEFRAAGDGRGDHP